MKTYIIYSIYYILAIFFWCHSAKAQSVTIYRAGVALSPTYSTVTAAVAATINGDSLMLSGHTFYEHNIQVKRSIKMTGVPNGTTIDAENKDRCLNVTGSGIIIRDIIFQNGYSTTNGGGILVNLGTTQLLGNTIIRNSYSKGFKAGLGFLGGGGIACNSLVLKDKVVITNNKTDGDGGGFYATNVKVSDSVTISYNSAGRHGGGGTDLRTTSAGVSIIYNTAAEFGGGILSIDSGCAYHGYNVAGKLGGAVYGTPTLVGARLIGNKAPKGAAASTDTFVILASLDRCYIYNLDSFGKRQSELHAVHNSTINSSQCWYGEGDTTGLFTKGIGCTLNIPSWVVPNWRLNRGKIPAKNDTLFPVQAALKYNTGAPLVAGSMPWLVGGFSASKGMMSPAIAPINAKDTVQSMFQSFIAPPISQPIDFLAYIDADTFRVTEVVWGRDTTTKKDTTTSIALEQLNELKVFVYPNPAKDVLFISGSPMGSKARLYDALGRQVIYHPIISEVFAMPIHFLPAGTYFLRITATNGAVGSAKVLKE
jgi:hypothetical protein